MSGNNFLSIQDSDLKSYVDDFTQADKIESVLANINAKAEEKKISVRAYMKKLAETAREREFILSKKIFYYNILEILLQKNDNLFQKVLNHYLPNKFLNRLFDVFISEKLSYAENLLKLIIQINSLKKIQIFLNNCVIDNTILLKITNSCNQALREHQNLLIEDKYNSISYILKDTSIYRLIIRNSWLVFSHIKMNNPHEDFILILRNIYPNNIAHIDNEIIYSSNIQVLQSDIKHNLLKNISKKDIFIKELVKFSSEKSIDCTALLDEMLFFALDKGLLANKQEFIEYFIQCNNIHYLPTLIGLFRYSHNLNILQDLFIKFFKNDWYFHALIKSAYDYAYIDKLLIISEKYFFENLHVNKVHKILTNPFVKEYACQNNNISLIINYVCKISQNTIDKNNEDEAYKMLCIFLEDYNSFLNIKIVFEGELNKFIGNKHVFNSIMQNTPVKEEFEVFKEYYIERLFDLGHQIMAITLATKYKLYYLCQNFIISPDKNFNFKVFLQVESLSQAIYCIDNNEFFKINHTYALSRLFVMSICGKELLLSILSNEQSIYIIHAEIILRSLFNYLSDDKSVKNISDKIIISLMIKVSKDNFDYARPEIKALWEMCKNLCNANIQNFLNNNDLYLNYEICAQSLILNKIDKLAPTIKYLQNFFKNNKFFLYKKEFINIISEFNIERIEQHKNGICFGLSLYFAHCFENDDLLQLTGEFDFILDKEDTYLEELENKAKNNETLDVESIDFINKMIFIMNKYYSLQEMQISYKPISYVSSQFSQLYAFNSIVRNFLTIDQVSMFNTKHFIVYVSNLEANKHHALVVCTTEDDCFLVYDPNTFPGFLPEINPRRVYKDLMKHFLQAYAKTYSLTEWVKNNPEFTHDEYTNYIKKVNKAVNNAMNDFLKARNFSSMQWHVSVQIDDLHLNNSSAKFRLS